MKVADFGIFGSTRGKEAERHNCGSLKYMAPEILRGRNESDPKIDVWSLGVMLYSMIMGDYPFYSNDKEQLRRQILDREIQFETDGLKSPLKKGKSSKISILKKG